MEYRRGSREEERSGKQGMRHCEECGYLSSYGGEYPETYCPLVSEDDPKFVEDEKGCGCRYNARTLKKLEKENEEAEYRALLGYDDFMLTNSTDMTEEDTKKIGQIIHVMMHTIGLWPEGRIHAYKRHGRVFFRPYQNFFCTAPGCDGYWMWERMQAAGHAEVVSRGSQGELWHLTRRGLDWLEMKLDMTIYDKARSRYGTEAGLEMWKK